MKTLVVGGAGFIGCNLCNELINRGHEVICVDNLSLGKLENINVLVNNPGFHFEKADASSEEIYNVFERYNVDYVFHLAANSDIQASALNPEIEYRNTYSTTFHILMAMKKHNVNHLFFASTSAVYGDKRNVVLDENTPNLEPISYYGAAKLGSEALISSFSYMNDIHSLIFRFPNVIGKHLTHGVIFDFMRKLSSNPQELQILGDGNQTKPYLHEEDLIDAILRFMDVPVGVTLYNVGSEGTTSVKTIADIVCEEMGLRNVKYQFTGGEGGWKGDVPRFEYCMDKIQRAGWKPRLTSDEAVRMSVWNAIQEK